MISRVETYCSQQGLLHFGDRILLTVSGGVDSVVMAHLFAEMELQCAIAHCNFGLRGEDSDADEAFVRSLAARLEIPVYVKSFDVGIEVSETGKSLQMAARDLRYNWFRELAREHGFISIATAHNLNDSVETFLLNLSRGTGIRGLTGIPPRNGNIIRPLLFASRPELVNFARQNAIAFREDASNRETKYQRNRIRHEVIPVMEQLNPAFLQTMASNMDRLRELRLLLENAVEEMHRELGREEGRHIRFGVEALRKLEPRLTWLFELFSPFGFTRAQCEGILQMLDAPPGRMSLSSTHRLFKDREQLILAEAEKDAFERYYLDGPDRPSRLPFAMDMELLDRDCVGEMTGDRNTACLDFDLIQFPLTIRRWLHGDYFCPLGMDHMTKLSDFFVDEKLSVPQKESTWILANGKKIAWIMGLRIDHRFRITEKTRKVLMLRLHPDI